MALKKGWSNEKMREYTKAYRRTKKGLTVRIFSNQVANAKRRGHEKPSYTKRQLEEWLFSQQLFHDIYNEWVASDYDKWKAPSVDRIDDNKTYSLDNIQLMRWKENSNKSCNDRKTGKDMRLNRPVNQYSLGMDFIKRHHSASHAGREVGVNDGGIISCCKRKRPTSGGFIWRYADA